MKNKIIAVIAAIVLSLLFVDLVFAQFHGRRVRRRRGHTVRTKRHLNYHKNQKEAIQQQKYLEKKKKWELQQKRNDDYIRQPNPLMPETWNQ